MSKLYDGNLTAWLQIEIDKALKEVCPPVTKYKEGASGVREIKTMNPLHLSARERLIAISREYAEKERKAPPVKVQEEVYHGEE
jgi:hypothetical protein